MYRFFNYTFTVAAVFVFLFSTAVRAVDVYDCAIIAPWKVNTAYTGGNLVDDGKKVYRCKPYPFSQWAGGLPYEPGSGLNWDMAWDEVGVCKQGTTAIDCNTLTTWRIKKYYSGNMVKDNNLIYRCKGWPYSDWCGIGSAYKPPTGANWRDAWDEVGNCNRYTMIATATSDGIIVPEGSFTVNGGTNQPFDIIPNSGNSIFDVLVNGASVGPIPLYTFLNISSNNLIQAIFKSGVEVLLTEVCFSADYCMAIKKDKTLWSWGGNRHYNDAYLGDGNSKGCIMPVQVVGENGVGFLTDVVSIARNGFAKFAVTGNGYVYGWGRSMYGELGMGPGTMVVTPPTRIPGGAQGGTYLTDVKAVYAPGWGIGYTMTLLDNGEVMSWGDNTFGVLGDGTVNHGYYPLYVKGYVGSSNPLKLTNIKSMATCFGMCLALDYSGYLYQWGSYTGSNLPKRVMMADGITPLSNIKQIGAIKEHFLALTNDGKIWAWGENTVGQLGIGTVTPFELVPTLVVKDLLLNPFVGVASVFAGKMGNIAIKTDGTVWTWGGLALTNGTKYSVYPIPMKDGDSILISAFQTASLTHYTELSVKNDGTLWGGGRNENFVLGSATQQNNILHEVKIDFSSVGIAPTAEAPKHTEVTDNDGNGFEVVTVDASLSTPGSGSSLTYSWWTGDSYEFEVGNTALLTITCTLPPSVPVSYTYLRLVVKNNLGAGDMYDVDIKLNKKP